MKVSVANHDRAKVYLDGHEVRHAFEADDAEGYVLVYLCNPNGSLQLGETQREIRTVRFEGNVTIERLSWENVP